MSEAIPKRVKRNFHNLPPTLLHLVHIRSFKIRSVPMQSAGWSHIYGSHDHGKLVTAIEQQAAEVVEILSEDEMLPKDRSGGRGAVQASSRLKIGCRFVKQTPSSQFARFPALIEMFSHL